MCIFSHSLWIGHQFIVTRIFIEMILNLGLECSSSTNVTLWQGFFSCCDSFVITCVTVRERQIENSQSYNQWTRTSFRFSFKLFLLFLSRFLWYRRFNNGAVYTIILLKSCRVVRLIWFCIKIFSPFYLHQPLSGQESRTWPWKQPNS